MWRFSCRGLLHRSRLILGILRSSFCWPIDTNLCCRQYNCLPDSVCNWLSCILQEFPVTPRMQSTKGGVKNVSLCKKIAFKGGANGGHLSYFCLPPKIKLTYKSTDSCQRSGWLRSSHLSGGSDPCTLNSCGKSSHWSIWCSYQTDTLHSCQSNKLVIQHRVRIQM